MTLFDWFLLIFVALKLTGEIDWSWWLVLLPLWTRLALILYVYVMWWRA